MAARRRRPPALSPITATFVAAEFSTTYAIRARDPAGGTLRYGWALQPPRDDPGCRQFRRAGARAVWLHGEQHGCSHAGTDHDGVVTVIVSNAGWRCRAVYLGSAAGEGPPPEACTRLAGGSKPQSGAVVPEELLAELVAVNRLLARTIADADAGTLERSKARGCARR